MFCDEDLSWLGDMEETKAKEEEKEMEWSEDDEEEIEEEEDSEGGWTGREEVAAKKEKETETKKAESEKTKADAETGVYLPTEWSLPPMDQSSFDAYRSVGFELIHLLQLRRGSSTKAVETLRDKIDKRAAENEEEEADRDERGAEEEKKAEEGQTERTERTERSEGGEQKGEVWLKEQNKKWELERKKEKGNRLKRELVFAGVEIESLSDGLIDLYVAQAMDWIILLLGNESKTKTILLYGITALSMVLKMHHNDNNVELGLSLDEMARATGTNRQTIMQKEMELFKLVHYDVFQFKDCYTTLLRYPQNLIVTQAEFNIAVAEGDFLAKLGSALRHMIVDRIEAFAAYSPWVRANSAVAFLVNCRPTLDFCIGRSPSRKEAKVLFQVIEALSF